MGQRSNVVFPPRAGVGPSIIRISETPPARPSQGKLGPLWHGPLDGSQGALEIASLIISSIPPILKRLPSASLSSRKLEIRVPAGSCDRGGQTPSRYDRAVQVGTTPLAGHRRAADVCPAQASVSRNVRATRACADVRNVSSALCSMRRTRSRERPGCRAISS
ncbi:hypothetical protein D9M68_382670 [compost metagenome]